jgi:Cu-Zn family superoxide dismutase
MRKEFQSAIGFGIELPADAVSIGSMRYIAIPLLILPLLAACSTDSIDKPSEASKISVGITSELVDVQNASVGAAVLQTGSTGSLLILSLGNMKAGTYGMHIHGTGRCETPDFKSAGGHWNPASRQHGLQNPVGSHAGDLPNLVVDEDGGVARKIDLKNLLPADVERMMDADGAALVIHAGPDDNLTDPSGNSGARIICGVFRKAT